MTVSHLTTPTAELEVGILNALTSGSFSHLSMSLAEIRVRILNELNGGSASYLTTGQASVVSGIISEFAADGHSYSALVMGKAEILAAMLNDVEEGGGGDVPEAPEGFAYLVNADDKFIINADGSYILVEV